MLTRYTIEGNGANAFKLIEDKEGAWMQAAEVLANVQEIGGLQQELGALRAKEPPLLQCIDCKNTESPAGAVARQFNHGRCMHCGGYFKVVRA